MTVQIAVGHHLDVDGKLKRGKRSTGHDPSPRGLSPLPMIIRSDGVKGDIGYSDQKRLNTEFVCHLPAYQQKTLNHNQYNFIGARG